MHQDSRDLNNDTDDSDHAAFSCTTALAPGAGIGALFAPSLIPRHASGIMISHLGDEHLSIFANAGSQQQIKGFRGNVLAHLTLSKHLKRTVGIASLFCNDIGYLAFRPGFQSVVGRALEPNEAHRFADYLKQVDPAAFGTRSTIPPKPGSGYDPHVPMANNCITAPREAIVKALNGPPTIIDAAQGEVDITRAGRAFYKPVPSRFERAQAGRAATMREYLAQPDSYFHERGLFHIHRRQFMGASAIRAGHLLLLGIGAVHSIQYLRTNSGEERDRAKSEELGTWIGGLAGGSVGLMGARHLLRPTTTPASVAAIGGICLASAAVGAIGAYVGKQISTRHHLPTTANESTSPAL